MLPAPALARARRATWIVLLVAMATAWLAPMAPAAEPSADFTVTPSTPMERQRAAYQAVLSEEYQRGQVQWDFDADPAGEFEKRGRLVGHSYARAGEKPVTMRVVRQGEVLVSVTKTVVVIPRPPEPDPEPGPVVPLPPTPPEQPPGTPPESDDPEPPAGGDQESATLMTPFPVVRIAGVLMPWGAKVRLLSVRTPRGATVTARCRGKGCPLGPLRRRARSGLVRFRSLERRLRAGIRLEIFVRQGQLIGKYTRFRIRSGARPLLRVDRCLEPGDRQPVRCPAA